MLDDNKIKDEGERATVQEQLLEAAECIDGLLLLQPFQILHLGNGRCYLIVEKLISL